MYFGLALDWAADLCRPDSTRNDTRSAMISWSAILCPSTEIEPPRQSFLWREPLGLDEACTVTLAYASASQLDPQKVGPRAS